MKNYILLQASSVLLFGVSATLNVLGYINLFPNNVWMAGSVLAGLELAKFTIVGVVYNMEDAISRSVKSFLTVFLGFLIIVSVIGHYAMLTSFYSKDKVATTVISTEKVYVDDRMKEIKIEIADLEAMYKNYPKGHATKRLKVYNEVKPQLVVLRDEYKELLTEKKGLNKQSHTELKENANVFKASAELMGISADKFAFYIIMMLSIILDPLALLMVYTAHKVSHFKQKKTLDDLEKEQELKRLDNLAKIEAKESIPHREESKEVLDGGKFVNLVTSLKEAKNGSIGNSTVQSIMLSDETALKQFKTTMLRTKEEREWFKLALVWREFGKIQGDDILMDFNKVKNINVNTLYGRV